MNKSQKMFIITTAHIIDSNVKKIAERAKEKKEQEQRAQKLLNKLNEEETK